MGCGKQCLSDLEEYAAASVASQFATSFVRIFDKMVVLCKKEDGKIVFERIAGRLSKMPLRGRQIEKGAFSVEAFRELCFNSDTTLD